MSGNFCPKIAISELLVDSLELPQYRDQFIRLQIGVADQIDFVQNRARYSSNNGLDERLDPIRPYQSTWHSVCHEGYWKALTSHVDVNDDLSFDMLILNGLEPPAVSLRGP